MSANSMHRETRRLQAKIIEPYINLVKELITIRINTLNQQNEQLAKTLDNAKKLEELEQLSDMEAKAYAETLETLTRQKELLTLQEQLLAVQKTASVAINPAVLEHQKTLAA